MLLEFILSILGNLQIAAFVVSLVGIFGLALYWGHSVDEGDGVDIINVLRRVRWYALGLLVMCCLPDINQLWRVRLGLIKFQLASPENIKAGAETIERVARKLECRYLGCKDDDK